MLRLSPLLLLLACAGGPDAAPTAAAPAPVVLGPEDVVLVAREPIAAGPRVTGTLEAAQKAVLRAETAGTVEVVAVEVGQAVAVGDVLARIEGTAARDALTSAHAGLVSAEQDAAVADREVARAQRLVQAGAMATRDLESAERGLTAARARVDAARAQLAMAQKQADATTVRAPIAGVVAQRAVGQGDVVAPGSPLFTVLDPSSLRLEGAVPADAVGQLQVGAAVLFTVQGQPDRTFSGTVARVAPAVDPATRQIPVIVDVPNAEGALIAGLFAEGQVATEAREGLVVPTDALVEAAGKAAVARVRDGKIEVVPVEVGLRNRRAERVEITTGLDAGDTVLVGAARDVAAGTPVTVRAAGQEG